MSKQEKGYMVTQYSKEPIQTFNDKRWFWHNGKPKNVELVNDNKSLIVVPTEKLDYWSKTFYGPEPLIISNGQTLLTKVEYDIECTITTKFTLEPREQFDQAGIMIFVDENVWVKAGIEYTDGKPNLSCVVTNEGFSDWSTQGIEMDNDSKVGEDGKQKVTIGIRVSKLRPGIIQGPSLIMEACFFNTESEALKEEKELKWFQVRIASLRSSDNQPWLMGIFSNSPTKQNGSKVKFHSINLGEKIEPVHDASL